MKTTIALDLILVGFGNVGRRFARLLQEQEGVLARTYGLSWRVVGIATRSHGIAVNPAGLDLAKALTLVEGHGSLGKLRGNTATSPRDTPGSALEMIESATHAGDADRVQVMVETTVLDIARGQPAIDHIRKALRAGAHVITANKGPVAFSYREIDDFATALGRSFLFEGAVMDGVPIFNLVRDTLPAVTILGFRGIINSTTNHILTRMEQGIAFGEALAEMQAAGIAEADASLDVDGWDAAAKTAALLNVWMKAEVTPRDIDRTGIAALTPELLQDAKRQGQRLRLVATGGRQDGKAFGRVAPELLPEGHALARLNGMQNALVLQTDLLGEICITQLDSGLTQTAYALLSDLVAVRRRLRPA
jgi:homoserine dehydrogenase